MHPGTRREELVSLCAHTFGRRPYDETLRPFLTLIVSYVYDHHLFLWQDLF